MLLFFHCIASLLWANKRIKLTRKKRRGFLVLVAVGKFNYYQNSLASSFCGQFMQIVIHQKETGQLMARNETVRYLHSAKKARMTSFIHSFQILKKN